MNLHLNRDGNVEQPSSPPTRRWVAPASAGASRRASVVPVIPTSLLVR